MTARGHTDILAAEIAWNPGSGDGIEYAGFRLDEGNPQSPRVILTRFAPGATVPAHTHDTNYFEYIIEGEQTVGKKRFGKGDVRLITSGTGYGPIVVGPEGCVVLIVFADGSRSMTEMLPRKKAAAMPA